MARGKGKGAKRGPKPKATKEDVENLAAQLKKLTKLVRQIHTIVVPEGAPEPAEEPEITPPVVTEVATTVSNGAVVTQVAEGVVQLPVEAEITEVAVKA